MPLSNTRPPAPWSERGQCPALWKYSSGRLRVATSSDRAFRNPNGSNASTRAQPRSLVSHAADAGCWIVLAQEWICNRGESEQRHPQWPPRPAGHNAGKTPGAVCSEVSVRRTVCLRVCELVCVASHSTTRPFVQIWLPPPPRIRHIAGERGSGSFHLALKNPLETGALKELWCPLMPIKRKCRHRNSGCTEGRTTKCLAIVLSCHAVKAC